MYGLIMAGGSGTRLWPKSRTNSPKQLHALVSEKSMFVDTVNRIRRLIPSKDIWVVTNGNYIHKIKEQAPGIPSDNIIAEPFALGTALGIGLGIMRIYQLDKDATVAVLWSDNHIKKTQNFLKSLKLAEKVAQESVGVIIGVKPTFPSIAYGYIQMLDEIEKYGKMKVFKINKFIEKPDAATAEELTASWEYLWNSGISVWKAKKFLSLFKKYLPKHFKALNEVKKYFQKSKEEFSHLIAKIFKNLETIPIDYAIYEKAKGLATVPADLGWSDIGNWSVLKTVLETKGKENFVKGKYLGIETTNCLVLGGERLIATIGLKDLVIVDTDDAILIASKNQAEKVKDLTQKLQKEGFSDYL